MQPLSVDTASILASERLEFLNDIYARERLVLAPLRDVRTPMESGSRLWQLGALTYATTYSAGHIGQRIAGKSNAVLAVRQHHTSGCRSWSEDGYFVTHPGDFIVTLSTVDGVHSCVGLESTNISIPVDVIDVDWTHFKSTQILRVGSLANRLLSAAIDSWTPRLTSLEPEGVRALEQEIVTTISRVVKVSKSETDEADTIAHIRSLAMRRYIEDVVAYGPPSAETLAKVFAVSRASVFRAFEADGGVRTYANKARLRKALFKLYRTGTKHGAVSRVSADLGYSDPHDFSKMFRRHFGFSPRDAMALRSFAERVDTTKP